MKALVKSAQWLASWGIVVLAACSGKLHAGSAEPSGSGGSAGGGAGSGAGSSAARPEDAPVVGPPAHCPATRPADGAACDVERAACGYVEGASYAECYCAESRTLALGWFCLNRGLRVPGCPDTPVTAGKSCAGHAGNTCSYPVGQTCSCESSGNWTCGSDRWVGLPSAPTAPAPATPINQLTEADRSAWCAWYELAMVGGSPEDSPVGTDGKVTNVGCGFGQGAACSVAYAMLSPGQCAQNLALSNCAAPIADLTDCITTTLNGCIPEPHGCARLMASPNCSGTIAIDLGPSGMATGGSDSGSPCGVRVQ